MRLDKYSECEGSKCVLVSKCYCSRYMNVEDAAGEQGAHEQIRNACNILVREHQ
jgi:hypothetical protein